MEIKKIKRSPTKFIEATSHPEREERFIKHPGKEIIDVTDYVRSNNYTSRRNYIKYIKATSNNPYTDIHTHPNEASHLNFLDKILIYLNGVGKEIENSKNISVLPSSADMRLFITKDDCKTAYISLRDCNTGKVLGYNVLKKNKKTPQWGTSRAYIKKHFFKGIINLIDSNILGFGKRARELREDNNRYEEIVLSTLKNEDYQKASEALKTFAEKYHLQHRMVPAQNYKVSETRTNFVNKGLEKKVVASIAMIFLATSISFSSSNLTAFTIASLTQKTSNIIGKILFVFGLIGALYYFRKKGAN